MESDAGITISTRSESLKKLRGILSDTGYSVDQFITEKREQAQREDEGLGL